MREMKDSGVEWIGEIPEDWSISRVKQLFFEVNERCSNSEDYTLLSVSEYYGVAPRAEKINDDELLTHAVTLDGYKTCCAGDIVVNIMLAWKRALGVSQYVGIVSPAYCVYRSKINLNPWYYHYLFRTDQYAELFKQHSTGIIDSRLRMYPDKFFALKCQVPPIEAQNHIVTYLDAKCAQIDAIIARQQEIIEKLKAYKLSYIGELTSGWGDVSCHLRYIGEMKNGLNFTSNSSGEEIRFLGVGDVKNNFILNNQDMFSIIRTVEEVSSDYFLKNEDIVFVRSNGSKELVGRSVMVENIFYPITFSGFCIRFRNMRPDIVNSMYLLFYFRSPHFRKQLEKHSRGTNINNMNQALLSQICLTFPRIEIQRDLVKQINEKCKIIDTAVEQKQIIIDKLTEYKKSLIYEVVTGKKEV